MGGCGIGHMNTGRRGHRLVHVHTLQNTHTQQNTHWSIHSLTTCHTHQEAVLLQYIEDYFDNDDTNDTTNNDTTNNNPNTTNNRVHAPDQLNTDDLPLTNTHPALDMDVRALLAYIRRALPDLHPTPRALARILHGIGSPAWPASQWSKHRDWGRRKDVAFEAVMGCAAGVLLESVESGERGGEDDGGEEDVC